jgi:hypothetical protein
MKWMPIADYPDALIATTGPYQAVVIPRDDRGWQVTVACSPAGQPQRIIRTEVCDNREAAQAAAETLLASVRRPGRLPKAEKTMTGTERSKQRAARLAAKAVGAEAMNEQLESLHGELGAAGLSEWADRVAGIGRVAALKAVAEYTRRNATFFVTGVPQVLDPEVRSRHIQHITALADKLDGLADSVTMGSVSYQQFEAILRELHKAGFWPENSLVSDVARAFVVGVTSPTTAPNAGIANV